MPPSICMDPKVHYITQSSCYATQRKGPLTDRAIARYKKQGWYGPDGHIVPEKRKVKRRTQSILAKLAGRYT